MEKHYGRYTFHKFLHLKFRQWIRKATCDSMCVFGYILTYFVSWFFLYRPYYVINFVILINGKQKVILPLNKWEGAMKMLIGLVVKCVALI